MDPVVFIGTIIVAVVQFLKYFVPAIAGPVTILVAMLVGLLVALLDTHIGLADISIATGIMTGLGASGVVTVANKIAVPPAAPPANGVTYFGKRRGV